MLDEQEPGHVERAREEGSGYAGPPQQGEVVICLKNKPPVYNGMRGVLGATAQPGNKPWLLQARIEFPDEGVSMKDYTLCGAQFNREKTFGSVDELRERGIDVNSMSAAGEMYDFGHAMTVHRAQGSQFRTLIYYSDMPSSRDEWVRHCYTAVTRASERLVVLT